MRQRGIDGVTDYQARINGQDVGDLDAYRIASPLFTLTFPENNIFGVEPGVAQAVSEAYSFIIAPPPPGEYEIAWTTSYPGEPVTPRHGHRHRRSTPGDRATDRPDADQRHICQ